MKVGGIGSGVVLYNLKTSDNWMKTMLKTLVERGGVVNSSGFRCMSVGTNANICRRFFGCVLVCRGQMVLLMENISELEGSWRESILA